MFTRFCNYIASVGSIVFVYSIVGVVFAQTNQIQAPVQMSGTQSSLVKFLAFGGPIVAILFALICLFLFIFWIYMVVHAASHPIENKTIWIVALLLLGWIAGIVYYFAVKRSWDAIAHSPDSLPVPPTIPGPGSGSPSSGQM